MAKLLNDSLRTVMSTSLILLGLLVWTQFHAVEGFMAVDPLIRITPTTRSLVFASSSGHHHGRDSSSSTMTPTQPIKRPESSLPVRKRTSASKKKKKKKSSKKSRQRRQNEPPTIQALTNEELSNHVHDMYLHGPGGRLRGPKLRAERTMRQMEQKQQEHLKELDRHPALVLNADYQPLSHLPLSLWRWQDAVKAIFSGKVTVVDVYPDVMIRAANIEIPLPAVIALNEYVPQFKQTPAFTKRNVFLRDEYQCQYCSDLFQTRDLSLDHVVPRCHGGRLVWTNAVTCCHQCNGRKGCKSLSELKQVGMRLVREPFVPTQYELARIAGQMLPRRVHPTWEPYLPTVPSKKNKKNLDKSRQIGTAGQANSLEKHIDG